jgi:hypothetical protein
MPELKRMLKVIGWGILPFSLCLLVSTRYSNNWDKQFYDCGVLCLDGSPCVDRHMPK